MTTIVQPGGSKRDAEVAAVVNAAGAAMVFTAPPPLQALTGVDVGLRNRTYAFMVERGRAPRPAELGDADAVVAGWRELHDAHALVLGDRPDELRMLNPFSCVPTPYRVEAGGRSWYANCAWDAFGICAALYADGRVLASCPDCAEPLEVDVAGGVPMPADLVFHVLVPARRWWDDIGFT